MPFPVEEKYIIQAEQLLGVSFPESFRNQMMLSNGGEIETEDDDWQLYPFLDSSDAMRLKRTSNDLVRETNQARKWKNFPKDAVAIAGNGCGDQLVFASNPLLVSQLLSALYRWDHETGELTLQAEDFSFLT